MCRTTKRRNVWLGIISMLCIAIASIYLCACDNSSNADKERNAIRTISFEITSIAPHTTSQTITTTTITSDKCIVNDNNTLKMSRYKSIAMICVKRVVERIESEKTTTTTTTSNTSQTITTTKTVDPDVFLLAQVIEAEGGHIPLEARARIGCVVMNRLHSDLFPNSIYEIAYSGEYETVNKNLLPETPIAENIELAKYLMDLGKNSKSWYEYCLNLEISDKTVFQANSCIDMHSYAYKILDEYGTNEYGYSWHMCYWESKYDYSDYGIYSEIHI